MRSSILFASASLAFALAAGDAAAQSLSPPYASYAAKFSCGTATADADVVEGTYATSVNIHNPQSQLPVQFFKKLVVANEEGQPLGKIVVLSPSGGLETLNPDQAERVDCPLIMSALDLTSGHVEGFVVIQVQATATGSPPPLLDVVAKYTARGGASGFDVVIYLPKSITM